MTTEKPFLSVVVPAYNEENRVENVRRIHDFLKKQDYSWELIVVDDGSTDSTLSKLEEIKKSCEIKIISYSVNRGKGFAVKTGVLSASGKYRLFMDIDLSTLPVEIGRALPLMEDADIVIGSRKIAGSVLVERQPWYREFLGEFSAKLHRIFLNAKVRDASCGFKCFTEESAEKIFPKLTIERWIFDLEILYLAQKYDLKVVELPVTWKNDPRSKVKFPGDFIRAFSDMFKIRWNDFVGRYFN